MTTTTKTFSSSSNLASDALMLASQLIGQFSAGNRAASRNGDSASVRALATQMQRTDSAFANDLFAAADQHDLASESPR